MIEFHDIEPSRSIEEALTDWSFLQDPEAVKVAERAARKIALQYEDTGTIEYDDAYQEALLLLSARKGLQDCLRSEGLGYGALYTRLCQDLVKLVRTEAKHRSRVVSYEKNLADFDSEVV